MDLACIITEDHADFFRVHGTHYELRGKVMSKEAEEVKKIKHAPKQQ